METCKAEIIKGDRKFCISVYHCDNCGFKECQTKFFGEFQGFLDYGLKIIETHQLSEECDFKDTIINYFRHYKSKPQKMTMIRKPYIAEDFNKRLLEYKENLSEYKEKPKILNYVIDTCLKEFDSLSIQDDFELHNEVPSVNFETKNNKN